MSVTFEGGSGSTAAAKRCLVAAASALGRTDIAKAVDQEKAWRTQYYKHFVAIHKSCCEGDAVKAARAGICNLAVRTFEFAQAVDTYVCDRRSVNVVVAHFLWCSLHLFHCGSPIDSAVARACAHQA